MSEPALKCNNNTIFKHNYTQKLLIAFEMASYCCSGHISPQKSFITSTFALLLSLVFTPKLERLSLDYFSVILFYVSSGFNETRFQRKY